MTPAATTDTTVTKRGPLRRLSLVTPAFYGMVLLFALLFPEIAGAGRAVHIAVLVCIYGILVYGLAFLYSAAGQLSVAHGALWGIGAYTAALVTLEWGWSFWASMPAAMVVAAIVAGLLGYPSLRVKGHYFLIASFAFAEIVRLVAVNWRGLTNGDTGLVITSSPEPLGPITLGSREEWYYFTLALLVVAIVVVAVLRRLPFGRRLAALRENEELARAAGVNTTRDKVAAFMFSGLFAGVAGTCWAYYGHYVNPHQFGINTAIELILMLLIGSVHFPLGPLVGVLVVICMPEVLGFSPTQNEIALGAIFIAIILLAPKGVLVAGQNLAKRWYERLNGMRRAP
ncbi:branched-chain amino acid ABC transporter permease [Minwuia thermotolerans]|uniref:branched-chain amino acid ABC transporter permease n=1 Tax=Minwuia thermotolerans TaxID=2056226 RepID=UPI000D6DC45A|nr:branched-chain amino acid ABC transporter permease [Minwuia thermotolerans]